MLEMISERHRETTTTYARAFYDDPNCGFAFPCDKNGYLLPMPKAAMNNYDDCISGKHPELTDVGIVKNTRSYIQPAQGKCAHCGAVVDVVDEYQGAFQCECGQWYNMFGQELLPPEEWE